MELVHQAASGALKMSVHAYALLPIFALVLLSNATSARPYRGHQYEGPDSRPPVIIICSAAATRCWSEGSLLHSDGKCYPPLTRGPCADGQWWLLERDGFKASARGRCAPLRCPPDVPLQACKTLMRQQAEACQRLAHGDARGGVHMDPKGDFRCGPYPGRAKALHEQIMCFSLADIGGARPSFADDANAKQCVQNDQGQCVEAVQDPQPIVTVEPEDLESVHL